MKRIEMLEMHLLHSCNLSCESCSHYSNHRLKGMLSLEVGEQWIKFWSHRINPANFAILGGEPTMHPKLIEFIMLVRKYWPDTNIQIQTNGFFLDNHPSLPRILAEDSKVELCLSVHHNSLNYWRKLSPQLDLLVNWKLKYGVNIQLWKSYERWTRRYKGFGNNIEPFEDGNPRLSWEICEPKKCPQLFNGAIWKCAPITYLHLLNNNYCLSSKWNCYLNYEPLLPDCTEEELNYFFDREEESICGMCPARYEYFKLSSPIIQEDKSKLLAKISNILSCFSPRQILIYLRCNSNLRMLEKD